MVARNYRLSRLWRRPCANNDSGYARGRIDKMLADAVLAVTHPTQRWS